MLARPHPTRWLLFLLFMSLIGLFIPPLVVPAIAAPPVSLPSDSPLSLVPLPGNCGGTTSPPCCARGYVVWDGQAVAGAIVTVTTARATTTTITEPQSDSLAPSYYMPLSDAPHHLEVGEWVTVTVSYNGRTATQRYQAKMGSNQTNLWLDTTQRLTLPPNESPLPQPGRLALSGDGTLMAFSTEASTLVPSDTNGVRDVFVHDFRNGKTTPISVASDGTLGNGASNAVSMSGDGNVLSFDSQATNLVANDSHSGFDIYVYKRTTGQMQRVSLAHDGGPANGWSWLSSLSHDGRFVAFNSGGNNLVPGDTNGEWDIFVRDLKNNTTKRVSISSTGEQASVGEGLSRPALSGDGRFVVFTWPAPNLVPNDTNGVADVFLHDRATDTTTRLSVSSTGEEADRRSYDPSISADGRYVVFGSDASNLVPNDTNEGYDIFLHDTFLHTTTRVSGNSLSGEISGSEGTPTISADGNVIAFLSRYPINSDEGGDSRNVFVYNRETQQTRRVSVSSRGTLADGDSNLVALSADGRRVAFASQATNLVSDDGETGWDLFVHDWQKTWTLFFYLAGDNDLHEFLVGKYRELEDAVWSDVTIVVVEDGDRPSDAVAYLVQPDGDYISGVNRYELPALSPEGDNSGNVELLTFLLTSAMNTFPADHYYLNIANHGHGLQGIGWDQSGPSSLITVPELHDALAASTQATGRRIDVLHLEACLMALLEEASDAHDYADYLIASQNLAWSLFPFRDYAEAAVSRSAPAQLAEHVATTYHEQALAWNVPHTISALDLAAVPALKASLDALVVSLTAQTPPSMVADVGTARLETQKFDARNYYRITDEDEFIDLYDFADHLHRISVNLDVKRDADALKERLDEAVVAEFHSSGPVALPGGPYFWDLEGSHGLALFFPPGPNGYGYGDYQGNALYDFTADSSWNEFLAYYFRLAGSRDAESSSPGMPTTVGYRLYLPAVMPKP